MPARSIRPGKSLDETYVLHSEGWKSATSYVALSRARERVSLFASKEVVNPKEPWMMRSGGFDALDHRLAASARQSFEAWAEENPGPASKYGLHGLCFLYTGQMGGE